MRNFLVILCITLMQLSYGFEVTEVSMISESLPCNDGCEVDEPTTSKNFFSKHIPIIKKLHESINKTIQKSLTEFTDKEPPANVIGKIIHDSANLKNTINTVIQSKHLNNLNQENICKPLCEDRKFLDDFSRSFIEEIPEVSIPKDFKTKVTSDWFKNGMFNIGSNIKTIEKHLKLEDSQGDLLSYLPLIKNKYRELTDTVCRILRTDTETFIDDVLNFNGYVKDLSKIMEQLQNNSYLAANKNITQFRNLTYLINGLCGYFINLVNKSDEILEELKAGRECYDSKSDAFIQDIMHMIFLYKYNKMDYKQMNNEVSQLITQIKNLQESKK